MPPLSSPACGASTPTPRRWNQARSIGSACSNPPRSRSLAPRVSLCSALRRNEASFGQDHGFAQSNLTCADVVAAGAIWFVSRAQSLGRSDHLRSAGRACRPDQRSDFLSLPALPGQSSVGSASWAQAIHTDNTAAIFDFTSASSAIRTDHIEWASALWLRRAVQPQTKDSGGTSAV